jgi:predicted nucleotidyltransferase
MSLKLQNLKKNLKILLKKYKEIDDIIIFGSIVKNKFFINDIDLALIVNKNNHSLSGRIKSELKLEKLDIEVIRQDKLYITRFGLTLLTEGFSIKNNNFIRDMLNLKPMKIYSYNIKNLNQSKKVIFGRSLNLIIKETNSIKLGSGCIIIPIQFTSNFEEFLTTWNLNFTTKEYLVL